MTHSWFCRCLLCPESGQWKKARFWAVVCSLIWLFCHYLPGIAFGWQQQGRSAAILLPTMLLCLLREALRSVLAASLKKTPLQQTGALLLTSLLLLPAMCLPGVKGNALTWIVVLDALCQSAMLTLLALHGGLIPGGIYTLATTILPLLIPLQPNTPPQLAGMVQLLLSISFLLALDWDFSPEDTSARPPAGAGKRILGGGLAVLAGFFLCFFVGLLPWHPVCVATGSMEPAIAVGDVAVVSTLDRTPQVGDVIQFQRDGVFVIHRVTAVDTVDGETVYITRGDANRGEDAGAVSGEALVGTVKCVVPWLGRLALWLRSSER